MGHSDSYNDAAVVVSAASRALRRKLRPLAWVVLEEVALDAVVEDGRLVDRTSARQVADRLGVHPSTAVNALGVLRRRGLLSLEREHGPAGRFGLSAYVLGSVDGLAFVPPHAIAACLVSPSLARPSADSAGRAADPGPPGSDRPSVVEPCVAQPHTDISCPAKAGTARPAPTPTASASSTAPAIQCLGQTALDFGSASL